MTEGQPLSSRFSEEKAALTAALLIHQWGERGEINYMRLLKLLYIVDRSAIIDRGHPIIGGRYFSLDWGPVPTECYSLTLGNYAQPKGHWAGTISLPANYSVRRLDMPDDELLSGAELDLIDNVGREFGAFQEFELSRITHDAREFPEWTDPQGSRIPIEWEDILRAGGKTPREVNEILRDALEMQRMQAIFEGP